MSAITHGDSILGDNVLAKAFDLQLAILQANNSGLYVKVEYGLDQGFVEVWRGNNIAAIDKTKAKLIRSESIPRRK